MRAIHITGFASGEFGSVRHGLARAARRAMSRLRAITRTGYRPEMHYMRGPGPKSREKQRAMFRDLNS